MNHVLLEPGRHRWRRPCYHVPSTRWVAWTTEYIVIHPVKTREQLFFGARIAIYTEGAVKLLVLVYIAKGQQKVRVA